MSRQQPRDEFIRKRMERQKKIRKRRLIVFFIFLIILLLCVGIALSLTVFFPIEKINISGSKVYTSKQIEDASGVDIGDNLFVLTKSGIEMQLKEKLPYVEKIKLKRQLPDTLNITVTDADEYACYVVDGKYYTVSKSGWVLKQTAEAPENLFMISGSKAECNVGSEIVFKEEKEEQLLLELMNTLSLKKIKTDYIDITDSISLKIGVEGRFTVELGTSNNIEEKINHLNGMLESLGEEKTGKINLSMWTSNNTTGTFVEGKIE